MDFGGRLDLVERLGRLRDDGAFTDEEFASAKASVLAQTSQSDTAGEYSVAEDEHRFARFAPISSAPKVGEAVAAVLVAALVGYLLLYRAESPRVTASAETKTAPVTSSSEASSRASEADAAMNAADAAAAQPADEASTAPAPDIAAGATEQAAASSGAPVVLLTKPARCRVHVPSGAALTGPCTFKKFSATEFEVTAPSIPYAAEVIRQDDGHHGILIAPDGTRSDLGILTQTGACWNNAQAEICAWAV